MIDSHIAEVTSNKYSVKIELESGVVLYISSNDGYFHFSVSGTDIPTEVEHICAIEREKMDDKYMASNTLNWKYNKRGEE